MPNVKNNTASQYTRSRLLEAAADVFAERGYHAATIKEITDRAGASLASVNYHFRDKSELYAAVLRQIGERIVHAIPPDEQLIGSPETRFRQFIQWFCVKAGDCSKSPAEQVLFTRELAQPSPEFEWLLKNHVRPLFDKLSALIAELLAVPVTDESVGLFAASVFGQCSYFMRNLKLLSRLHPQFTETPDIQRIASHIADFSLAALHSVQPISR
jgi:TetR/AcrR family transcriptional regulator, regulator of cefoperazone and chloramphenicol sensitivity